MKLPHIEYIHQLQNVYYDLTSDVLVIPESKSNVIKNKPEQLGIQTALHKVSGPGKYQTNKNSNTGKTIGEQMN